MYEMRLCLTRGMKLALASLFTAFAALGVSGCGGGSGGDELNIAYQPGIGYAQILIMKEEGWLQEDLGDEVEVNYQELNSGSAIRDGMISGDIQVGSGGVGPFLIGYDSGVGWKLVSGLNHMELWLMGQNEQYQSLQDFEGGDARIATPANDSIQAVVLKRAAQEELGNADALDNTLVAQGHPEAQQALLSGQLTGHLTSPPFQFVEQEEGAVRVLGSYEYFGEHTFNSVFATEEYYNENPEAMRSLYQNVQRANDLIQNNPERAAQILSEETGGEESAEYFEKYITEENVTYTTEPQGFLEFAEFMQEIGFIEETPSCSELAFDTLGDLEEC